MSQVVGANASGTEIAPAAEGTDSEGLSTGRVTSSCSEHENDDRNCIEKSEDDRNHLENSSTIKKNFLYSRHVRGHTPGRHRPLVTLLRHQSSKLKYANKEENTQQVLESQHNAPFGQLGLSCVNLLPTKQLNRQTRFAIGFAMSSESKSASM